MMFEKAKPSYAPQGAIGAEERFAGRAARRAGDALRAVEWSELTARLNAARDLRLLLRSESQGAIEAVAASFGDAAASYFALLDDSELPVNRDALGQLKDLGAKIGDDQTIRAAHTTEHKSGAPLGDARDMK
jgi:hypothetical protein